MLLEYMEQHSAHLSKDAAYEAVLNRHGYAHPCADPWLVQRSAFIMQPPTSDEGIIFWLSTTA